MVLKINNIINVSEFLYIFVPDNIMFKVYLYLFIPFNIKGINLYLSAISGFFYNIII